MASRTSCFDLPLSVSSVSRAQQLTFTNIVRAIPWSTGREVALNLFAHGAMASVYLMRACFT